jgi:hypothetical protein
MAAEQPPEREPQSSHKAVPKDGFLGVHRARGDKPAGGREEWGDKPPIQGDGLQHKINHPGWRLCCRRVKEDPAAVRLA